MDGIINPKVDLTETEDMQNEQDELIKALHSTIQGACEAYWRQADAFRGAVRSARAHKVMIEDTRQMYARLAKRNRVLLTENAKLHDAIIVDSMLLTQRSTELDDANRKIANLEALVAEMEAGRGNPRERLAAAEAQVEQLTARLQIANQDLVNERKVLEAARDRALTLEATLTSERALTDNLASDANASEKMMSDELALAREQLVAANAKMHDMEFAHAREVEQLKNELTLARKLSAHQAVSTTADDDLGGLPLVHDRTKAPDFAPPERKIRPAG